MKPLTCHRCGGIGFIIDANRASVSCPSCKGNTNPLNCVCGHEKKAHKIIRWISNKIICSSCLECREYRPAIPLSDLWVIWEEAKKEGFVGKLSLVNQSATFLVFERKLKELEKQK